MAADVDALGLLARALGQAEATIDAAQANDGERPTPCRSWNLDLLVRHLFEDLHQFRLAAQGGRPSFADVPADVAGDRAAAFAAGAAELLDLWRQVDLGGIVELPIGTFPTRFVLDQQITEFTVHSWDLATALGSTAALDPELAEISLAWAHDALLPEYRGSEEEGKSFGPEVPAGADAPPYDRLAGFFGRHY